MWQTCSNFAVKLLKVKMFKKINNLLALPLLPITRNAVFFVMMFILGTVCTYAVLPERRGAHVFEFWWQELFVDVYFVCALLAALPEKVRRWVRLALYIIFYAIAIVDVYCFVKFDSTLTPTMLLLVGETNSGEASEFFRSYFSWDLLSSRLGWVLLVLLVNIIVEGIVAWVKHRRKEHEEDSFNLRKGLFSVARTCCLSPMLNPLLSLLVTVFVIYCLTECWTNKQAEYRLMSYDNIGDVEHELTEKTCANLYLPVYRFAFSVYANRLTSKQVSRLVHGIKDAVVDSCSYTSPNIVLVIGESYNRHHSQLYGYEKPTAPRQLEREQKGELIKLEDVVSSWNLTSYVFKQMFSMYAVGDKDDWCDYPLFPELFRNAGYHVTFITNQFLPQAKEAVYDFSGGFFLNNEKLSKAMFDTRNQKLYDYDDGVTYEYDRLKKANTEHNLIILHLRGQHVHYASRVPKAQKHFTIDDYQRKGFTKKERQVMADYDNALLYNDSIVDEIVKRFEQEDAIVIYVPDHGEECYDGDVHFFGRMHSTEITARLAHEEFDIPMWFWCSERYREAHPDIVESIRKASTLRYMTDALPHTLLRLAGISTRWYRPSLDILSNEYDDERPRILKLTTDYDKLGSK